MFKLFMRRPTYGNTKDNSGFAVLIGVLIVGAFGVAVALYLVLSGLYSYQNSFVREQSLRAKTLANSCAESALNHVQLCSIINGAGSVQIDNDVCNYEIIINSEQGRIIQATATVGTSIRKVKLIVSQIDPLIIVDSWQEVADF